MYLAPQRIRALGEEALSTHLGSRGPHLPGPWLQAGAGPAEGTLAGAAAELPHLQAWMQAAQHASADPRCTAAPAAVAQSRLDSGPLESLWERAGLGQGQLLANQLARRSGQAWHSQGMCHGGAPGAAAQEQGLPGQGVRGEPPAGVLRSGAWWEATLFPPGRVWQRWQLLGNKGTSQGRGRSRGGGAPRAQYG